MKNYKNVLYVMFFLSFQAFSQSNKEFLELSSGFNRIGFYNDFAFKFEIKQHQINLGLRHYTLDNFFEKNTVGMSVGYKYIIHAQNNKFYFYPGINANFFKENKSIGQVFLSDFKLISGVGLNLNHKWSLFYQLGLGVVKTRSELVITEIITKVDYFNYEIALGISYSFGDSSK